MAQVVARKWGQGGCQGRGAVVVAVVVPRHRNGGLQQSMVLQFLDQGLRGVLARGRFEQKVQNQGVEVVVRHLWQGVGQSHASQRLAWASGSGLLWLLW